MTWRNDPQRRREYMRAWRVAHSDELRAKQRAYYVSHREKQIAAATPRAVARNRRLRGWSQERYDEFLAAQGGRCAICSEVFVSTPRADHDHTSRTPRGLLCNPCNSGIGLLRDSPAILASAAEYLSKWKGV